jgi:hypothetical protein
MKHAILLSTMVLLPILIQAQTKVREPGITFSNLNHFGLNYKTGSPSKVWRFTSMYAGANAETAESDQSTQKTGGAHVSIFAGREYRKNWLENLEFRYGFDLAFRYSNYKNETSYQLFPDSKNSYRRETYQPGFNGVLGLNYIIKEKLILGGELMPGFTYINGKETTESGGNRYTKDVSGFNFSISSSSILFTLAYRFIK